MGFGEHHWNAGKMKEWMTHFQAKVGVGAYLFYDFRNLLCDPTKEEVVQRGVDGRDQNTIQAIYGEPRFPEVMIQCTKEIMKMYPDLRLIIGKCKSGYHRMDTSCRTLEEIMNNLWWEWR